MSLMASLLALVSIFVVNQLGFWGATPILLGVAVYPMRYELDFIELLFISTIYGFVISTFTTAIDGLLTMLACLGAGAVSVMVIRVLAESKLRTRVRGFDAVIMAITFSSFYWLILGVSDLGSIRLIGLSMVIIWSAVMNLGMMVVSDIAFKRLGR